MCVYFYPYIWLYTKNIFIPPIAELYNEKNEIRFDSPLQVNKIKYRTRGLKKTNTMNPFLLLTTHTFVKSHTKQIKSNRIILNKLFLIS